MYHENRQRKHGL
jgi:hypothetical protein